MRKLAFRYRRVKEIYSTYKNNVGGELWVFFLLRAPGDGEKNPTVGQQGRLSQDNVFPLSDARLPAARPRAPRHRQTGLLS